MRGTKISVVEGDSIPSRSWISLPPLLAEKRVETLYRCDDHGRILSVNYFIEITPPRFFLMRTRDNLVCRLRYDVPDGLAAELESLCREEPQISPSPLPVHDREYRAALALHAPVQEVWSGPVYVATSDATPAGGVVAVSPMNIDLLRGKLEEWHRDVRECQPIFASLDGDRAASVCASVRISATAHCAGVETLDEFRRRGHAAKAVSAWAREVRSLGATPFYSTSWDNLASQAVALKLNMPLVAVDYRVT